MKKLLSSALVGFGALYIASSASAAITFEFNTIISGSPVGGPTYATLTIENGVTDTVDFTMFNSSDSGVSQGQFISKLLLNVDPYAAGTMSWSDPTISGYSFSEDGKNDSAAKFDYQVDFVTANNGDRFVAGKTVTWSVTSTGLTENHFDAFSAHQNQYLGLIHIQAIPGTGGSAKVVPVPEPASFAALGIGVVAILRRRKFK